MKIDFPRINKVIDFSEYAPEFATKIHVWVNPPLKTLEELSEAFKTYVDSQGQDDTPFLTVTSDLLSQTDDKWSVDDLRSLMLTCNDTDPAFWIWLQNKILETISNHRLGIKKA